MKRALAGLAIVAAAVASCMDSVAPPVVAKAIEAPAPSLMSVGPLFYYLRADDSWAYIYRDGPLAAGSYSRYVYDVMGISWAQWAGGQKLWNADTLFAAVPTHASWGSDGDAGCWYSGEDGPGNPTNWPHVSTMSGACYARWIQYDFDVVKEWVATPITTAITGPLEPYASRPTTYTVVVSGGYGVPYLYGQWFYADEGYNNVQYVCSSTAYCAMTLPTSARHIGVEVKVKTRPYWLMPWEEPVYASYYQYFNLTNVLPPPPPPKPCPRCF